MSALTGALEALCKAGDVDVAEVKFIRVDTRRGTVQFITARGVHRAQLDPPAPVKKAAAKRPAKKAAAKKSAAKKAAQG